MCNGEIEEARLGEEDADDVLALVLVDGHAGVARLVDRLQVVEVELVRAARVGSGLRANHVARGADETHASGQSSHGGIHQAPSIHQSLHQEGFITSRLRTTPPPLVGAAAAGGSVRVRS